MKRVAVLFVSAAGLAVLGVGALAASRYERALADAQAQAATGRYEEAAVRLDAAERALGYGRWLPHIGARAARTIEARRAALRYWQGQYEAILPAPAEPVAAVDEHHPELQLIVANAAFRAGQRRASDRESLVQALDEAASGFLTVLKNDPRSEDAAFNYEYVSRLRDDVARGRRPPNPQAEQNDFGESGAPARATGQQPFKIYVPLQGDEKNPEGGDAGKASARERKG
jgi:hypothetical protein